MDKYAVIVAGGSGQRMGTSLPKQFLLLKNKPVIWYTLQAFLTAYADVQLVLVLPEQHLETGRKIIDSTYSPKRIHVTSGGATRFHSVQQGLKEISHPSIVFIHDGVRCLVTTQLIKKCFEEAVVNGNAVPAVSAIDSIRLETEDGNRQLDRKQIKIIQTPQTFHSGIITSAFKQEYQPWFTDEASVVENMGVKINLVEGEVSNIKITRPFDLLFAEGVLSSLDAK